LVGSALALRRFGVTRFRQDTTHAISEIWEVLALSCNSLLFLLVGLSVSVGALFDRLRKEYPRRREFFNTCAVVDPPNSAMQGMLSGIGFTVA